MRSFYLAPCLVTLRAEIDRAHPLRDRRSDGWIGDARHSASKSDHNPDRDEDGVVRALDVDKDGVDMVRLLAITLSNPAVEYVIWNGFIYSRRYGFKKRVYTGKNKHKIHMHISCRHGGEYENRANSWGYTTVARVVKQTVASSNARGLQLALRTTADGLWGPTTDKHINALRLSSGYHGGKHPYGIRFTQLVVGTNVDGDWGPKSIKAHHATTENVCRAFTAMGVTIETDSQWTPTTEMAYREARAKYLR